MATTWQEREIEIKKLIIQAQHEYQRKIEPYIKELADIELCKPPNPVTLPDGRVMSYTGPLGVWTPDRVKHPDSLSNKR